MNNPNPTPESPLNVENVTIINTKRPRNLKKTIFKSLAVVAVLGAGAYVLGTRVDLPEVAEVASAAIPE